MKRIYAVLLGTLGVLALLIAQSSFPPSSGGGVWGTITGTLSAQADLASALAAKLDTSGTAAKATALASTPSKCGAGNYPLGVDTGGNAQNCTAAAGGPSITSGAYSSLPGTCTHTSTQSDMYYITDAPYVAVCTATNTWQLKWNNYNVTAPPTCAALTMINQGGNTTNTCTNTGPALTFAVTPGSASCCQNWFGVQTAPATPYSFTTRMNFSNGNAAFLNAGIIFRNSSSGKAVALEFYNQTLRVEYWSATTTDGGSLTTLATIGGISSAGVITLKILDDGTNRKYYWSGDGVNFMLLYLEARTTNFTADQVGFVDLAWSTNQNQVTWWDWTQGTN
ncbi:MAG: hypothetical protein JWO19_4503 [Bryobacterales bacterium]|jgi:hypothetical protein|nr:hypothetical protein [Bryobacterales bacterium]